MPGRRDQQDQSFKAHVALLCADVPLERLDIAEARLCLNHDVDAQTVDHDISASQIPGQWHGYLGPPSEGRRHSDAQAFDEGEVSCVADRCSDWIEEDSDVQAEDDCDRHHTRHREMPGLASLNSTDGRMRDADHSRDHSLAESCRDSGRAELLAGMSSERELAACRSLPQSFIGRHADTMTGAALSSRIWIGGGWNMPMFHVTGDRSWTGAWPPFTRHPEHHI